jgi:hypothetical protein
MVTYYGAYKKGKVYVQVKVTVHLGEMSKMEPTGIVYKTLKEAGKDIERLNALMVK